MGDKRPPAMFGSMGDSGGGDKVCAAKGVIGFANCSRRANVGGFVITAWISLITMSIFEVSDGLRRLAPRWGLDAGLIDSLDDSDAEGVWYGLLAPNSFARLGIGGASPVMGSVFLMRLVPRGGRGLDRSGPDWTGCRGLGGEKLWPWPTFDGRRAFETGSEGRLGSPTACKRDSAFVGNVWDLFSGFKSAGSSCTDGAPNPP
jgi:hypothetical protein